MAKTPPKKTKKNKKKIDPVEIGLQQLAMDGRQSARAVRALGEALELRVKKPDFEICKFVFDGKKYRARFTAFQCEVIQEAVQKGTLATALAQLLGNFNLEVANAFNALSDQLGNPPKLPASQGAPLGCCVYDGGKTPNLSQAQCSHYHPISWGSPADCSGDEP